MKKLIVTLLSVLLVAASGAAALAAVDEPPFVASKPRPVTSGPKHHFFGYYGISPWDTTGRYMLSLESDFQDRMPGPDDAAGIVLINTETLESRTVAKTYAWNLQQGALQQWLPASSGRKIIYNDRRDGRIAAVILDVDTGAERVLPAPVSDVSRDGKKALSLNYGRIARLYPVIGYAGLTDGTEGVPQPDDDGISVMNIETGEVKLAVSVADVVAAYKGPADLAGKEIWLSHAGFNPSGTRFYFLVRYQKSLVLPDTAMFTADADGGNLRCVIEFGRETSHFGWRSDTRLVATMSIDGKGRADDHVLFDDVENPKYERLGGGALTEDGHPSFSPDGRWMLTDTYPDAGMKQHLFLLNMETGKAYEIASFRHSPKYLSLTRCDLHPRWKQDGTQISIDSIDKGSRQVYVIDLKFRE